MCSLIGQRSSGLLNVFGHQVIDELGVQKLVVSLGLQHIHGWEGSP